MLKDTRKKGESHRVFYIHLKTIPGCLSTIKNRGTKRSRLLKEQGIEPENT
jgi:hypothetical protein